jgi:hypothetical protein
VCVCVSVTKFDMQTLVEINWEELMGTISHLLW